MINNTRETLQSLKEELFSVIVKEESRKNSWISFLFIAFCFLIYGYLNYFTPPFYSKDEQMDFIKNFAVSKDSGDYLSSIILSNYTHLNLWHILPNCFFFFAIAKNLGGLFSWKNIALLVVISTFTTGFLSYWHVLNFSDNPDTLVIGFSGIVFSIFGVLFYFMKTGEKISNLIFIGGFHLFFMVGHEYNSSLPNIAWFAHLYGFLTGFVFALIVGRSQLLKNHMLAEEIARENYQKENKGKDDNNTFNISDDFV